MRKSLALIVIVMLAFNLAACGKKKVVENVPIAEGGSGDGGDGTGGVGSDGIEGSQFGPGNPDDPNDPLNKRVVYFEYDSPNLDAEGQIIAEAHAQWLASNPGVTVVLEGHADERGTREYNLALGENRAQSVMQVMQGMGVSGSNIQSISYGEERPVALGADESSWSLNRRVEIIYGN